MISVDGKNCTDCGVCYEVCPSYVFSQNMESSKKVTVRYPDLCSNCGHCISICPVDAITHEALLNEDFQRIESPSIQPSDLQNLIMSRRSIRKYQEKQVPEEIIDQLIECGIHARRLRDYFALVT